MMRRFGRWALIGMTTAAALVTVWDAAFSEINGRIFLGTSLAISGIFLIALWDK